MISINEAFEKFRKRLVITDTEQKKASARHQRVREQVADGIKVDTTFLTGSYRRHTKTKPLKDVDIVVVLHDDERNYLDQDPSQILKVIEDILLCHYPAHRVERQRRSVRVDFGVEIIDDVADDVVSFDVVPAFTEGDHYVIPDTFTGEWIDTNPKVHADKATAANKALDGFWIPCIQMIKKWNDHHDQPIKPSFLLEVMALKLLTAPWTGSYPREVRQFFASAADRLSEGWPDSAGLGPDVSDRLDSDPAAFLRARQALVDAEKACTEALRHEREGRIQAALDIWQELFGPLFAKS